MAKTHREAKHNDMGKLVRYLGRESDTKVILETTDGSIERRRGDDFHTYFMAHDPTTIFAGALTHKDLQDMERAEKRTQPPEVREDKEADQPNTAVATTAHKSTDNPY